jgi:hypothetical protein
MTSILIATRVGEIRNGGSSGLPLSWFDRRRGRPKPNRLTIGKASQAASERAEHFLCAVEPKTHVFRQLDVYSVLPALIERLLSA